MTATTPGPRWYVRPEAVPIRFGEARRSAIVWAVYRYNARNAKGEPILHAGNRTRFPSLGAAFRWARNEARRTYWSRTR
ncbi:hypothetical protein JNB62_15865 [Microbacterium jejuense]|uniref:Uncharacterized protein n=1 Tax=Microbacterium jejuense TaxID=1263637 RepID=A0ABS7HQL8_9MICO|nr:hypothetical protein [Microbacterium jejuense]MBW9095163.1 hypothetical protein [Microbacterium jejuense]